MVEEALDMRPPVKPTMVEVETPYEVGVKGKAPPPEVAQAVPVFVIFPVASVCKQLEPEAAAIAGAVRKPLASMVRAETEEVAVPAVVVVAM